MSVRALAVGGVAFAPAGAPGAVVYARRVVRMLAAIAVVLAAFVLMASPELGGPGGRKARAAREKRRIGAGNGTRTRDIKLGKLALYQLSYARSMVVQRGI